MIKVQTPTGKRKKPTSVWLIDDNEIDNFINGKVLERCGLLNILTFTSTISALQYLTQTNPEDSGFPQLILLDLVLPVMDGFEFLDKFATLDIDRELIDIYVLTCSVNPADREKARQKNCAFIEKPLTAKSLLAQRN